MVSYDTTQMALFVSLVLTVAATGIVLVLGLGIQALVRNRQIRPARQASRQGFHGKLAFHH